MFELMNYAISKILDDGGFINIVINDTIKVNNLKDNDKSLFTKVVYGVVEKKIFLDYQLSKYLNSKVIKDVNNYLRIGCFCILFLNLSKPYVVNTIVEIIKQQYVKYVSLTNAILRNIARNGESPIEKVNICNYYSIKYSYPYNLVTYIYKMYPNEIEDILCEPNNTYNTYRINDRTKLKLENIDFKIIDDALITKTNLNNSMLVKQGILDIQNPSSMEVVKVLNPEKGKDILDMCSAPGTKVVQLALYLEDDANITSIDLYPHKVKLIEQSIKNHKLKSIKTIVADSTTYNFNKQFDYIMLDAPCSGLGVMKHKVDLKYRFSFAELENIYGLQKALLGKAYLLLKDNGIMTYSTCTINKMENEEIMRYFLKKHKDMEVLYESKRLPDDIYDGFYICKLIKRGK